MAAYTRALENLRQQIQSTNVVEKAQQAAMPTTSSGFMPRVKTSVQIEAPDIQYEPLNFARDSMSEIVSARKRFEEELVKNTEKTIEQKNKVKEEITKGFLSKRESKADDEIDRSVLFDGAGGGESPNAMRGPAGGPAPARAEEGTLLALIDRTEGAGNYSTLFGHSQRDSGQFAGVDVTQMTLAEVKEFSNPRGAYGQWVKGQVGRVATPMGRYQIVGTTLRNVQEALNLPDDTLFSPQVQDQMADYLIRQRLASANSMEGKMRALRAEWEGFKHVSDSALMAAIRRYEQ